MSLPVGRFWSMDLTVYACNLATPSSEAFSLTLLVASSTTPMVYLAASTLSIIFAASTVFFVASSTQVKSIHPYSQLVSCNFCAASLKRGMSTKLCQTIFSLARQLSIMMYSSGSGKPTMSSIVEPLL